MLQKNYFISLIFDLTLGGATLGETTAIDYINSNSKCIFGNNIKGQKNYFASPKLTY
jgi:hypothetical protein